METPNLLTIIIITIVGLISSFAESIRFEIKSGDSRCMSEDIKTNSVTVGSYIVLRPIDDFALPNAHKLNVKVTSMDGIIYHRGEQVDFGEFAFAANEDAHFATCFSVNEQKPEILLTVDFEWKTGVATRDWTKVAKKGQIDSLVLELKRMYEAVESIHDEMFTLRERDQEMLELNRSTNSKMAGFGFLTIFICLSVAGLQLWHLKTYFERKKLL